jgi:hypothetical protein
MKKDTKQTAVEWLFDQIPLEWTTKRSAFEAYKQALEKEKEQIEIAFDLGRNEVTSDFIIDGEDYYNKKFNK